LNGGKTAQEAVIGLQPNLSRSRFASRHSSPRPSTSTGTPIRWLRLSNRHPPPRAPKGPSRHRPRRVLTVRPHSSGQHMPIAIDGVLRGFSQNPPGGCIRPITFFFALLAQSSMRVMSTFTSTTCCVTNYLPLPSPTRTIPVHRNRSCHPEEWTLEGRSPQVTSWT